MLVATAGHIDHGKTSLIRALTGVETDRLPEEKARGISIDLGFAYWPQPDGRVIGFVDVPGHERFVRSMIAGISGIDLALLVVAADDGVMPQTIEHVQILGLLGVQHMVVAITKVDCVADERIAEVTAQVKALLAPTAFAGAQILPLSPRTGAGITGLADALRAHCMAASDAAIESRNFRMAIDRAFIIKGAGTIVTGTALAGKVRVGDRLLLSPSGLPVRVRGLQSAGAELAEAQAGQRCAINLAGVERGQLGRGDCLLPAEMHAPTSRIMARLRILPDLGQSLRHTSELVCHLHGAVVSARVMIAKQPALVPGAEAVAHLLFHRPVCAMVGDNFVLRDPSGQRLVGGGRVIDPFPPAKRSNRIDPARIGDALEQPSPGEALTALLEISGYELTCGALVQRFNLNPDALQKLLALADVVPLGRAGQLLFSRARYDRIVAGLLDALRNIHTGKPELAAVRPSELRSHIAEPVSPKALSAILRILANQRRIELVGAAARLPGHQSHFSAAENANWRQICEWQDGRPPRPFTLEDAAAELRIGDAGLKSLLRRRCASREAYALDPRRFLLAEQVEALVQIATKIVGERGFSAAQFRDASGIGRNMSIIVLEFLDRIKATRRRGELRFVIQNDWRTQEDSNLWPLPSEGSALSS